MLFSNALLLFRCFSVCCVLLFCSLLALSSRLKISFRFVFRLQATQNCIIVRLSFVASYLQVEKKATKTHCQVVAVRLALLARNTNCVPEETQAKKALLFLRRQQSCVRAFRVLQANCSRQICNFRAVALCVRRRHKQEAAKFNQVELCAEFYQFRCLLSMFIFQLNFVATIGRSFVALSCVRSKARFVSRPAKLLNIDNDARRKRRKKRNAELTTFAQ